ncbi:MAG: TraB/GumN family protein, partial [Proteobacteria bacterium]|nr:TraB/GumN family protein [Pseudomonadota bacterium]
MLRLASMIVLALWAASARAASDGVAAGTLTPQEIVARAQAVADDRSVVPAARRAPNPALFVARDADSTMYLFGTLHVLKPGDAWS